MVAYLATVIHKTHFTYRLVSIKFRKYITLSCTAKAFRLTVSFFTVPLLILGLPTCAWDLPFVFRFCSEEPKVLVCVTVCGSPTEVLFSSLTLIKWIAEMKFYLLTDSGMEFKYKWWGKYLASLDLPPVPALEGPSPEAGELSLELKIWVWVTVSSLPPWTITVPKLPVKHRFHIRR